MENEIILGKNISRENYKIIEETKNNIQSNPSKEEIESVRLSRNQSSQEIKKKSIIIPSEKRPITRILKFNAGQEKILSVKFDDDENFIAAASVDGHIRIFMKEKCDHIINLFENIPNIAAATCLKWKPFISDSKNILLTGHSDGNVNHWHVTSKKIIYSINEPNNEVYTIDHQQKGNLFCTAGRDGSVRVYDEGKMKKGGEVLKENNQIPAHINRVFASKFVNENLLLTGGWDKTIILWDVRTLRAERCMYGPMVYGESLDIVDDTILTGSWRDKNQLELWDLYSMKKKETILYPEVSPESKSFVYSCQFQKDNKNKILVGTSGSNELRVFERKNEWDCTDIQFFEAGVFTVDSGNGMNDNFLFGGGNGICELAKF